MGEPDLTAMEAERAAATDAVLNSDSPKRLIISGPGTGKTFTFGGALERAGTGERGERGVALTFIKNLVADLQTALGELAYVDTFHGYCKHLMHERVEELRDADLYPFLPAVLSRTSRSRARPGSRQSNWRRYYTRLMPKTTYWLEPWP